MNEPSQDSFPGIKELREKFERLASGANTKGKDSRRIYNVKKTSNEYKTEGSFSSPSLNYEYETENPFLNDDCLNAPEIPKRPVVKESKLLPQVPMRSQSIGIIRQPKEKNANLQSQSCNITGATVDSLSSPKLPIRPLNVPLLPARKLTSPSKFEETIKGLPNKSLELPNRMNLPNDSDSDDSSLQEYAQTSQRTEYPELLTANRNPPCFKQDIPSSFRFSAEPSCIATNGKVIALAVGHKVQILDAKNLSLMEVTDIDNPCISMLFTPQFINEKLDWLLWLGLRDGQIIVATVNETISLHVIAKATSAIMYIFWHGKNVLALEEQGILTRYEYNQGAFSTIRLLKTNQKISCAALCGNKLWVGTNRLLYVYLIEDSESSSRLLTETPLVSPGLIGDFTGVCASESQNKVFFTHQDGKVSVYDNEQNRFLELVSLRWESIPAIYEVDGKLWIGFQDGSIYIYDTASKPWRVCKFWKAHKSGIKKIVSNMASLWQIKRFQVLTSCNAVLNVWDGMTMDDWVDEVMRNSEKEFCDLRCLKIQILTWNVGNNRPKDLEADQGCEEMWTDFLNINEPPDIIAFGFQEVIDLGNKKDTAMSLLLSKKKSKEQNELTTRYQEWQIYLENKIEKYLGNQYKHLKSIKLVGLFSSLFLNQDQVSYVRNLDSTVIKTGLGGRHGNKGALITRFILDDTSLSIVNCHLAAGQHGATNRNNDIADILHSHCLQGEEDNDAGRSDVYVNGGNGSMILDHEYVFLSGDLNYRISLGRDSTIARIKKNELEVLLEHDQLSIERRKNPNFWLRSFREASIKFNPTYKYNINTDKYDTSDKRRVPAWCDRILVRASEPKVICQKYDRYEIKCSDHRPVYAKFLMHTKRVNNQKKRQVLHNVIEDWHSIVNEKLVETRVNFFADWLSITRDYVEKILNDSNPMTAFARIT